MMNDRGSARITFRHLERSDLALMHRWLNQAEVNRWYAQERYTLAMTEQHYGPRLNGQGNVLSMIVEYDGEPIGYVQRYFTRNHPDHWSKQSLPDDSAGIDLFIGEENYQHRGFGPMLIRAFLKDLVFADERTGRCIIDPDPDNAIAIRAYEKVGFRHVRTIGPPEHNDPCYLMMLERSEFERTAPDSG